MQEVIEEGRKLRKNPTLAVLVSAPEHSKPIRGETTGLSVTTGLLYSEAGTAPIGLFTELPGFCWLLMHS
jgi:hypothetical protein